MTACTRAVARTSRLPRLITSLLVAGVLLLAVVTLVWDGRAAELLGVLRGEDSFVILRLRLPRVILAVEVGIAFALAGALFQTVLRNDLASPDILGISEGALESLLSRGRATLREQLRGELH